MALGFLTLEQWRSKRWVAIAHFDGNRSLNHAVKELERRGKPGFFRIVQTQRMIWAEKNGGKLRLRKWHANDRETLSRTARAFDRDRGRWPNEGKQS
jgi:hypothetical protein